jgi:ribosome-associated protein
MEHISKTQKKREARVLQTLGERLVKLKAAQLSSIELPTDLLNAVLLAKTIKKFGPLDRQLQYIGTLMRRYDPQPIQEALQEIEQGTRRTVAFDLKSRS